MITGILVLICAIALSAVAAFFSVIGITQIFSYAPTFWAIATMAIVLEISKLIIVSALYQEWRVIPAIIKTYLCGALIVLMFITSVGVFGYLARAHYETVLPAQPVKEQITQVEGQVARLNQRIADNNDAIEKIRQKSVDEALAAKTNKNLSRTQKATAAIESQGAIKKFQDENVKLTGEVNTLQTKKNELLSNLHKIEAEVGPIKYLALLIFGSGSYDLMDRAIRIVILLIVSVFDPLAVAMLLIANVIFSGMKKEEEEIPIVKTNSARLRKPKKTKATLDPFMTTTVAETEDAQTWQTKQMVIKEPGL